MSDYWFFLSYARRTDTSYTLDVDDKTKKLVRRFYEELAAEIISVGDTKGVTDLEKIGFFDQVGIGPGDPWDVRVGEALRTTRVMLCLYSRNYFLSKVCGQEFEIFRSRVADYARDRNMTPPSLIIPILWHRPDKLKKLPEAVKDLQTRYDDFSKVYSSLGLAKVMDQHRYDDEYKDFLNTLAYRIVDVVEEHSLPPLAMPVALKEARNAFAEETTVQTPNAPANARVLADTGPDFVHFVFVVGQRMEFTGIRTRLDGYAQDPRLWKPYMPDTAKPVGLLTQRVALDVSLQHEVLPVTSSLVQQLQAADESNAIVILIVDPWTLNLLQAYRDQMKQYDKLNLISCAVLVVWNENDQEPGVVPATLQQRVRETFLNNLTRDKLAENNSVYIRTSVASEGALINEVTAAIVEIRRRLSVRAKLFRDVDDAGYNTVPQVTASSGDTA